MKLNEGNPGARTGHGLQFCDSQQAFFVMLEYLQVLQELKSTNFNSKKGQNNRGVVLGL